MGTTAEALAIVEEYVDWARTLARTYRRRAGLHPRMADDIEQDAMLGLIDAAGRYDVTKGTFTAFAYSRVMGAIVDGARELDWLSRGDRRAARSGEERILVSRPGGRGGTMEIPMPTAQSLSGTPNWEGQEEHLLDVIVDEDALDPAKEVMETVDAERCLALAMMCLTERERIVITLYYYEGFVLHRIADYLGVTESRVSQLHTKALLRLRANVDSDLLEAV